MLPLQVGGLSQEEIEAIDSTTKARITDRLEDLSQMSPHEIANTFINDLIKFGGKVLLALVIFFAGRWIIKKIIKLVDKLFERRKTDQSIRVFVRSLLNIIMMIVLLIIIIDVLGLSTSLFIAIFASAGLALGVALSGTLQNFAGGVMILLLRPFRVGDYINAQGFEGTVKSIQLFNTVINTPDNRTIIMPNGPLSTGTINNASLEQRRRLELTYRISYDDDFDRAKALIEKFLSEDARIFDTPKNEIILNELADDSINMIVRAWVPSALMEAVRTDLNKRIYREFPQNDLHIPGPQLTVSIKAGDGARTGQDTGITPPKP